MADAVPPVGTETAGNVPGGRTAAGQEPPSPHFERPPLNEVVCGVQFIPIPGWLTSHFGLFWSQLRSEYPWCEDHPPLPRLKLDQQEEVDVEVGPLPPLRRVFLVHKSENYVIRSSRTASYTTGGKQKSPTPTRGSMTPLPGSPNIGYAFARFLPSCNCRPRSLKTMN